MGLEDKQALCAFPMSLMGNSSRWYYNLDPSKNKVWNELVELFMDQFIFNTTIDVTLGDLKTTKQGFNETFSKYMMRWKNKVSMMVNRPNEKDQISMIIMNLLPAYNKRLLSLPINYFADLCDCGKKKKERKKKEKKKGEIEEKRKEKGNENKDENQKRQGKNGRRGGE
ncbi:hypothetical protein SO802_009953 [Lithocarpus litseifolius]|uniref:Retrotransposon gag domain-containing protein n=1 Tax=Lithocarpus litseifolius TaxID=425828 RepID=A0AAW2DIG4_9ROSI